VSDAADADVTTWAKVLWDNENLYLGVYAEDPHLRGDEGAERDRIEVVIESPGDTSLLAHLTVHADGTSELQTLRASDGSPVADAEAIDGIEVAVSHDGDLGENDETDASWTAEIRVPWSALPGAESAAPISNQTAVRTNLLRVDVGGDAPERTAWSTTGSSRFTDPSCMGVLRFTGAPRRIGTAPKRP
jgi:hypothetical protein